MKKQKIGNLQSDKDYNLTILTYIKTNDVSIEYEIENIQAGLDIDLVIKDYFYRSPDYQKLQKRINQQRNKVLELETTGGEKHQYEAKKLAEFERAQQAFKVGALQLADTFLKIKVRTERLKKARDLFEQGLILEADKVLVAADLMNDQDSLIAQMDYLQQRKLQLQETIKWLKQNE